jgi:hypothetical protein
MRSPLKALLITASLAAASLGAATSAAAATAPPTLITTNFACSNGVCEVGPGNVGMSFAAGMYGTGGPTCTPGPCNNGNGSNFVMSVVSGSLPPGLQLDNTSSGAGVWDIDGTPAQAGTYAFTLQITPWNGNEGGIAGPSGTQQLTITIGTGHSDRAQIRSATWDVHCCGLAISGWDANISALWSVSVTSTGKVLISNHQEAVGYPIDGHLVLRGGGGYPCPSGGCDLTVTNNLGSSVTVFLGKPIY